MKALSLEPEIVTRRGKPVSVILSVAAYEKLLARLEDAEDAVAMKEARKKPQSFRPISEYLAERKVRHA
ncbi:MAG: type II toxin-antitoxin system prevent-host-death family antitoxin [Verrucomicrobiota bacterium]